VFCAFCQKEKGEGVLLKKTAGEMKSCRRLSYAWGSKCIDV